MGITEKEWTGETTAFVVKEMQEVSEAGGKEGKWKKKEERSKVTCILAEA